MNHKECLKIARDSLSHIDTNNLDAELLMMHILKVTKIDLVVKTFDLSEVEEALFFKLVEERKSLKPIAYILKEKEFMGLDFYVDENVLIPRPDTEILLEEVIKIIKANSLNSFLEIGSGSGCIAISLSHFTGISGISVDIFSQNLEICKKNALNNDVHNVDFILSDIYEKVNGKFDLIISNPPYIDIEDLKTMGKNVVDYEPHSALFAENNGLYFYENIIKDASHYLNKNGFIAFEIGYNQRLDVITLLENYGFTNIISFKDYGDKDRVVIAQLI